MTWIMYDIEWELDQQEAIDVLMDYRCEQAAECLGISADLYANMTTDERLDYAYDYLKHCHQPSDLFDLPDKVVIPDYFEITGPDDDFEEVTDWLSDEYGLYVGGFKIKSAA